MNCKTIRLGFSFCHLLPDMGFCFQSMNSIVNRIDLALSAQYLLRARHLPLSENLIFRDSTVLDMHLSFVVVVVVVVDVVVVRWCP